MSSVHRTGPRQEYEYNRVYSDAEKRQVTPEELLRWLNLHTFGIPDPAPDTRIRPLVRANTIAFWKKRQFRFTCLTVYTVGELGATMVIRQSVLRLMIL